MKKENVVRGFLDAHTHILPGMDDGSRSVRESIELIRRAAAGGAGDICLTPHFYPRRESPDRFLARREESVRKLQEALCDMQGVPRMHIGAEVEYFEGIAHTDVPSRLSIGSTPVLLIEMPFGRWTDRVVFDLLSLRQAGILPMVAHVERYAAEQKRGLIDEMADEGILFQANASFFLHWTTSLRAMHMLKNRRIHMLGSDCHSISSRPPNLGEAMAKILASGGESEIRYLKNMQQLILGRRSE